MSRVLGAGVLALALLAFPDGAPARQDGGDALSELRRFLSDPAAPPPSGATPFPVDAVHSSDPFTGSPFDPASPPLPEARPVEWGAFRVTGEPGALAPLFDAAPGTRSTPQFDALERNLEEAYLFFVTTLGHPIETADGFGANFNFDVDPQVSGQRLDGNPTAGDCAIDMFRGGGEESLMSSVATPEAPDFPPVGAPLLRILQNGRVIFVAPPGHPCVGAGGIAPATYGVAGGQAVKHEVVVRGQPFLPLAPETVELPPAPAGGAARDEAAQDEDGGGGSVLPFVLGGAAVAGTGAVVIRRRFRSRRIGIAYVPEDEDGDEKLPGAYEGEPPRPRTKEWDPPDSFDYSSSQVAPEEAAHIGDIIGAPELPPEPWPPPAEDRPPAPEPPPKPPEEADEEKSVLDEIDESGGPPGLA